MSELLNVFSDRVVGKPYFTVDTTGPLSVAISPSADSKAGVMFSGEYSYFQEYDNFRLMSLGLALPENFVLAKIPTIVSGENTNVAIDIIAMVNDPVLGSTNLDIGLSGGNAITLPMENYEYSVDTFINMKKLCTAAGLSGSFYLKANPVLLDSGTYPMVSMVGVPSAFNTTVQTATVFLKIIHNKALKIFP